MSSDHHKKHHHNHNHNHKHNHRHNHNHNHQQHHQTHQHSHHQYHESSRSQSISIESFQSKLSEKRIPKLYFAVNQWTLWSEAQSSHESHSSSSELAESVFSQLIKTKEKITEVLDENKHFSPRLSRSSPHHPTIIFSFIVDLLQPFFLSNSILDTDQVLSSKLNV